MGIGMVGPVAPVRQRHVIVDGDRVDIGIGPERVQMEEAVALGRDIAEIFRPVGGIGDLGVRPQQRAHLCRQRDQRGHGGKAVGRPANLRQAPHFRADAERIHPARRRAQRRLVQDEAAVAPFLRAGIGHVAGADGEIGGAGGAEEIGHLGLCRKGAVGAARLPRRLGGRDPPAPWQHGLVVCVRIRIGQAIVCQLVHQDERVIHHLLPARLQRGDGLYHGLIGGRAAIDRVAVLQRHLRRIRRRAPGHGPRAIGGDPVGEFDLGLDKAVARAQVGPEPGHHHHDRLAGRQFARQRVQPGVQVGQAGGGVQVHRRVGNVQHLCRKARRLCGGVLRENRRGGIGEIARAGHERHALYMPGHALWRIDRAHHLERQLRHAVAEGAQLQVLYHDIGNAAIGGRVSRAFDRVDQRVGQLVLCPGIQPDVQVGGGNFLPIRPDAANPRIGPSHSATASEIE